MAKLLLLIVYVVERCGGTSSEIGLGVVVLLGLMVVILVGILLFPKIILH